MPISMVEVSLLFRSVVGYPICSRVTGIYEGSRTVFFFTHDGSAENKHSKFICGEQ